MNEHILELINSFNSKIEEAYNEKYRECPGFKHFISTQIDLKEFLESYQKSKYCTDKEDITEKVILNLMDIKLEIFFIWEVEIGQYNSRVIDKVGSFEEIKENNYIYLVKLNLDQNMIYKTRVLWERIMNLVYLVGTQKLLETKNSKKQKFKNFIKSNEEWNSMYNVVEKIEAIDNAFRTPETHKYSRIRSMFLNKEDMHADEFCMNLVEVFINETYPNILNILMGQEPSIKSWGKTPDTQDSQLKVFSETPEWMKKLENARTVGNFIEPLELKFDNTNKKEPGDLCEYLVNTKGKDVLLTHNAEFDENGTLVKQASIITIMCEKSEEKIIKNLVESYLYE